MAYRFRDGQADFFLPSHTLRDDRLGQLLAAELEDWREADDKTATQAIGETRD